MTEVIIQHLGRTDYVDVFKKMKAFTESRTKQTSDELWLTQHYPVFTQGLAGKPEHILASGDIPIIQSDRGGQVTYHAPGQLVLYFLMDIRRAGIGVRQMVSLIEHIVIDTLKFYQIDAHARPDAPGVYVVDKKIASLGLRVRQGCTYHGLSLNVDMDLSPFQLINPCGYQGLVMTQLNELVPTVDILQVEQQLLSMARELIAAEKQKHH